MNRYRAEIKFFKEKGNILDQMDVEATDKDAAIELIKSIMYPALGEITSIEEITTEEE